MPVFQDLYWPGFLNCLKCPGFVFTLTCSLPSLYITCTCVCIISVFCRSHTLKNKGDSKGSSKRWYIRKCFGSKKNHSDKGSLFYLFIIWRTFFRHKEPFVKQKGSSDVKGSFWNHLDKKVLLWHHEAPLFLRVHLLTWVQFGAMPARYWPNSLPSVG